ncbi:hypothetical protein Tco_0006940 [Tanacetum coccineum]
MVPAYEVSSLPSDVIHINISWRNGHMLLTNQVDGQYFSGITSQTIPLGGPQCPRHGFRQSSSSKETWLIYDFCSKVTELRGNHKDEKLLFIPPMMSGSNSWFQIRCGQKADKYGMQMLMRFNEIHKFSDGTLQQIDEALDYRVKEFKEDLPELGTALLVDDTRRNTDYTENQMMDILSMAASYFPFVHIKMEMASTCSSRIKFIATCSYSRLNDFTTSRKNDLKLPQL